MTEAAGSNLADCEKSSRNLKGLDFFQCLGGSILKKLQPQLLSNELRLISTLDLRPEQEIIVTKKSLIHMDPQPIPGQLIMDRYQYGPGIEVVMVPASAIEP